MRDPARVRMGGALAPLAEGFRVALAADGYTWRGSVKQLHLFAHLSRWLEAERLALADLDRDAVERFFLARREAGYTKLISVRAAEPMLRYVRSLGFIADTAPQTLHDPVEELLARYRRYLVGERGLLAESAQGYSVNVRPFLEGLAGPAGIEFGRLDGPAVVSFVVATCPGQTRSSAKRTVKALRSLLRFLHVEGYVDRSLAHAVPTAAGWRLASLPKRLEADQVERLLAAPDRSTVVGRRDFAMLMLLARLGLRVGEVAALSLDDVDWRADDRRARQAGAFGHAADARRRRRGDRRLPAGRPPGRCARTLGVRARQGTAPRRHRPCSGACSVAARTTRTNARR